MRTRSNKPLLFFCYRGSIINMLHKIRHTKIIKDFLSFLFIVQKQKHNLESDYASVFNITFYFK